MTHGPVPACKPGVGDRWLRLVQTTQADMRGHFLSYMLILLFWWVGLWKWESTENDQSRMVSQFATFCTCLFTHEQQGSAEPVPAVEEPEVGYTLDRLPAYGRPSEGKYEKIYANWIYNNSIVSFYKNNWYFTAQSSGFQSLLDNDTMGIFFFFPSHFCGLQILIGRKAYSMHCVSRVAVFSPKFQHLSAHKRAHCACVFSDLINTVFGKKKKKMVTYRRSFFSPTVSRLSHEKTVKKKLRRMQTDQKSSVRYTGTVWELTCSLNHNKVLQRIRA